ncbi:MAG: biotin/lipoyl-binding protein [Bacteroidales bacterium]|nr:biotin/lipoyl-binding protein [Bacteroidales bacterium]
MKEYNYTINGKKYTVVINSVNGDLARVNVNGKDYEVVTDHAALKAAPAPKVQPAPTRPAAADKSAAPSNTPGPSQVLAAAPSPSQASGGKTVTAPLPGVITGISVSVGDSVKTGQTVASLEAMKMENAIECECDGTVRAVHVQKGDSVLEGAAIMTIG